MMRNVILLRPVELAVLLETLGGPPLDAAALTDLKVTRKEVALARQALRELGVLAGANTVDAETLAFLAPTLLPERVFILRAERRDQPQRQVVYSAGADHWVRNDVTPEAAQRFLSLTSAAAALEDVLRETSIAPASGAAIRAEVQPLAEVLRQASGMYLLASGPMTEDDTTPPAALSWITTGDGVWWINPAGPPETAQRCGVADLRRKIELLLNGETA